MTVTLKLGVFIRSKYLHMLAVEFLDNHISFWKYEHSKFSN